MFKIMFLFLLILYGSVDVINSLNILGVFPAPVKSHYFVFQPFMQELAKRGHNVTVISYFDEGQSENENYHVIDLSENSPVSDISFPIESSWFTILLTMSVFHTLGAPEACKTLLSDENVQNLWLSQKKFDVAVVEQFDSDCGLGLAYKLGVPVVGLTSHMLLPWHYNRLGVPYNPSYVLFDFLKGGTKPTFLQRLQRTLWYNYFYILNKYVTQKVEQKIIAEYFEDVPPLEELGGNIRFMLLYQNLILTGSSLLPANVKEVGGYHIRKPKPLPDDIKNFIEESQQGIIYISFGSILKASSLPVSKLEEIIAALAEFPQRVIWKWNHKSLPGNPKNIYVSKWLPQNDILAHPKVLAFFSHCGLLGTTEAIHHGVPILCMPILADQPSNAAAVEESGLGVQINVNDLIKENIARRLKSLLEPDFRERVKHLSRAWKDRPMSAMDSAIYWTEFASRHNFTYKCRSADVPLYQYLCLDIFATLALIVLLFGFCVRVLIVCCKRKSKVIMLKNKHD